MEVFWVVIFVDLIFISIAYLINKDNAKYLVIPWPIFIYKAQKFIR